MEGDSAELRDGKVIVHTNQPKSIGLGVTADQIVKMAYGANDLETIFLGQVPKGRYDFIASLPHGAPQVLQLTFWR